MCEEGYKELATAIVMQWVKDYKVLVYKYLNCKDRKKKENILAEIKELKKEAHTEWFYFLGLKHPDMTIKLIHKQITNKRTQQLRRKAQKEQRGTY